VPEATVEATLPDRWALAAGRASTKGCVICRGPRVPGARLCAPCKAALKRARLETVSELIPRPSRAAAEEDARRRRKKALAAAPKARPTRRWWIVPALFIAVIAIGVSADLALHAARRAPEPAAVAAPSQPAAPLPRVEPANSAVIKETVPAEAAAPHSNSQLSGAPRPSRAAPKHAVATPPVASAAPADRFPNAAPSVVLAPAPIPEAVSPVREAPAPDRWQVMADQIVRCGRDGFFAGVMCEQRVRLKYCDGYWGQVAQCPSGIPNDHGR
jgi:hypothetical protein